MITDEEVLPWIRKKLETIGLKSETNADIYGAMHILGSDRRGMEAYMRAYKCELKQGVIANLTAALHQASDALEHYGLSADDYRTILKNADEFMKASAATTERQEKQR